MYLMSARTSSFLFTQIFSCYNTWDTTLWKGAPISLTFVRFCLWTFLYVSNQSFAQKFDNGNWIHTRNFFNFPKICFFYIHM